MDFLIIAVFVLMIIGIVLVFKFIKHLIAAIAITLVIIFIVLAGIGIATYMDIQDIQKHVSDNNLVLFKNEEQVFSAFEFKLQSNTESEGVNFIDASGFDAKNIDYDELSNKYYKIIQINESVASDMFAESVSLELGEKNASLNITSEDAIQIIESDRPIALAVDIFVEQNVEKLNISESTEEEITSFKNDLVQEMLNDVKGESQFKGMIIGVFIMEKAKQNPSSLISGFVSNYKSKEITVYKKTMIFRILDMTPKSILLGMAEKFKEKLSGDEKENVAVQ